MLKSIKNTFKNVQQEVTFDYMEEAVFVKENIVPVLNRQFESVVEPVEFVPTLEVEKHEDGGRVIAHKVGNKLLVSLPVVGEGPNSRSSFRKKLVTFIIQSYFLSSKNKDVAKAMAKEVLANN